MTSINAFRRIYGGNTAPSPSPSWTTGNDWRLWGGLMIPMPLKFKEIPDWPGYSISTAGDVWSCKRRKLLARTKDPQGYIRVHLYHPTKGTQNPHIHRLVLETFVGPCPESFECRHLNGDRTDNRLENLRWGSRGDNTKDQIQHRTFAWKNLKWYK